MWTWFVILVVLGVYLVYFPIFLLCVMDWVDWCEGTYSSKAEIEGSGVLAPCMIPVVNIFWFLILVGLGVFFLFRRPLRHAWKAYYDWYKGWI